MLHQRWLLVVLGLPITAGLSVIAASFDSSARAPWLKALGVFWALGPPVWFLWEWHTYQGPTQGEEFEVFKLSQERAKDLWIGVAAALVIAFGLKG